MDSFKIIEEKALLEIKIRAELTSFSDRTGLEVFLVYCHPIKEYGKAYPIGYEVVTEVGLK